MEEPRLRDPLVVRTSSPSALATTVGAHTWDGHAHPGSIVLGVHRYNSVGLDGLRRPVRRAG